MKTSVLRTLAPLIFSAALGPVSLMAHAPIHMTIPFDFTVGSKSLPAGEYHLKEQAPHVLAIQSVDGHANPYVTDPNDWTVIAQTAKPMLTMSTCTPEGTARQRLVARAQLVAATNTVPGASVK